MHKHKDICTENDFQHYILFGYGSGSKHSFSPPPPWDMAIRTNFTLPTRSTQVSLDLTRRREVSSRTYFVGYLLLQWQLYHQKGARRPSLNNPLWLLRSLFPTFYASCLREKFRRNGVCLWPGQHYTLAQVSRNSVGKPLQVITELSDNTTTQIQLPKNLLPPPTWSLWIILEKRLQAKFMTQFHSSPSTNTHISSRSQQLAMCF